MRGINPDRSPKTEFAVKLQALRKERGLTWTELAHRSKVDWQNLRTWVYRNNLPRYWTDVIRLAYTLEIPSRIELLAFLKAAGHGQYSFEDLRHDADAEISKMLNYWLVPDSAIVGVLDVEHRSKLQRLLISDQRVIRERARKCLGREKEIAELAHLVEVKRTTGGYIAITGPTGQGKSSIIARLVEAQLDLGKNPIYHFIRHDPGLDYQVILLRDLLGRLILKHNLPDLYASSESRPVLDDYFLRVLEELSDPVRPEVIYIDGLDLLKPESGGTIDLTFLPPDPLPGVVFVLGTRPLGIQRELVNYELPGLSLENFKQVLQHYGKTLDLDLAEWLRSELRENALFLDLAAQALADSDADPQTIIAGLGANPAKLFTFALNRLKRFGTEWHRVIHPLLGYLLVAQEPLELAALSQLVKCSHVELVEGLQRLGGLVIDVGQGGRELYHPKLREYLLGADLEPEERVFAVEEIIERHQQLAAWCEQGGAGRNLGGCICQHR